LKKGIKYIITISKFAGHRNLDDQIFIYFFIFFC